MSKIGCDNFYFAPLTKDDSTGVTYGGMKHIEGLVKIDVQPASSNATLYADNGPAETASALGKITVSVETKDLPLEDQAALLGHTVTNGVMVSKTTDTAPYVGIAFESQKGSGGTVYKKYLKVRFSDPQDNNATKGENISFQTPTITGEAVARAFDKEWKREADTESEGYEVTTGTSWFTTMEATA